MSHKPIILRDLCISFPHKTCFEGFYTQINFGARIAIIGQNGVGKSTLLGMLLDDYLQPAGIRFSYVPQIIEGHRELSGGERFNASLTAALAGDPDALLLDEPTNHLDQSNRKSLMRLLRAYHGTLIIISHDMELLRNSVNTLWHIDNGKIHVFGGKYDDYINEKNLKRSSIEHELAILSHQKNNMHKALMQEQARAKNSRARGEKSIAQRKWPTVVSATKAIRGEETSGRKKSDIRNKKQNLTEQLADLRLSEIIKPKFSISSADIGNQTLLSISEGTIGYDLPILHNISLNLTGNGRIAIRGNNGSGKTTLLKAILNDSSIKKTGDWYAAKLSDIGYLDQHYATLNPAATVFNTIKELLPGALHIDIRRHLNDFLFRKNEEVTALVSTLSGGEKARLSLAQIAAKTPKLLIIDEVTNNLDLETRKHVIGILKDYPGAMLVISHDEDFLNEIQIRNFYDL